MSVCKKTLPFAHSLLFGMFLWAYGAPTLTVNAGFDQPNIGTEDGAYLNGEIGGSAPAESVLTRWVQISGPATAQIADSSSAFTKVIFTAAGVYTFELRAAYGSLTAVDAVIVTVHISLPFKILHPAEGEPVVIGKPFTIRWQMDISAGCDVYFSLDSGLSFNKLTLVSSAWDSLVWNVDPTFSDSVRTGIIKVQIYQSPINATSTFVLVDPPLANKSTGGGGCGTGAGLAFFPAIGFKLASLRRRRKVAG